MRLSVVIATKDRARYLERALESFGKQIGAPSFEVIVVDNGSTDDTRQIAQNARYGYSVSYVYEAQPNRGAARNRGIAAAQGHLLLFCDDDIYAPPGFLAAHDQAHTLSNFVVSGPIVNVPGYAVRPKPTIANFSRAFFCTCNVSVPKVAIDAVGGFDEQFHLYGWEDTELGARLRDAGVQRRFIWRAFLWHIKPPDAETLDAQLRRAAEKGRMAARYVRKRPSRDAILATGAFAINRWKGRLLTPAPVRALLAGALEAGRVPRFLEGFVRAQLLDGVYLSEMEREFRSMP